MPPRSSEDKWLLRKFKEIPVKVYDDLKARAKLVERSRRPHLELAQARANGSEGEVAETKAPACMKRKRVVGRE